MSQSVPFVDLRRLQAPLRAELQAAFDRVLDHGVYILGPEVAAFELQLAQYLTAQGAVGVSCGTDALLATFLALKLPAGSEILMTPLSFVASASSVLRAGLRPVFVDLPEAGFHPDVGAFEAAWGANTAGILAVHLFGEPFEMGPLVELCDRKGGVLVEDCAQAIGARAKDGRSVGCAGKAGTLSFFPAKNLGAIGDGGAVFSDDEELLQRVTQIRQHGRESRDVYSHLGGNFRLDALQAAFLAVLLPELDGWVAARRNNAEFYRHSFEELVTKGRVLLPKDVVGHGWNQFCIRTHQRAALRDALSAAGVGHAVYYTRALHQQGALAAAQPAASLPNAERCCDEVVALPVYPGLTVTERDRVVEVVSAALA
ncbi:MAG TPA: transcriptional regulator [Myxococcales bacterium]|nr:transcriptional regulator [Myxococcales bacterium]HAN31551.1 transcriptional regulator [Myxococcales bacterium]